MKAEIIIDKAFEIDKIDCRIYGSFIEHIGRAVYGGIYEPEHSSANEQGFRTDILDLVKDLNVPIVRYPGGNFVSGYHWEDGIGEKSKRPTKVELAWKSIETNEVGIDEFQEWAKQANTEVMMAVNLGTRNPEDAQNLVEYCNSQTDTYYARLRRENGFENPFKIKTWCLGNEMDGPWQIGHKTADEYARAAVESAKLMKWIDPDIELVACGSSNYDMPTFGEWEYTVLEHAYEYIDYISLHQYYGKKNDNTADYLGRSVHMDAFIKSVVAICDAVKAKKHSDKTINLSFDEWNVWFRTTTDEAAEWQIAPALLEEVYNFEDALVVGGLLITLQNNCDRVKVACLAQLINVIAPIMTQNGGDAWIQTIYYPYMYCSINGRGTALKHMIKCDTYTTTDQLKVPYIDASVIHNEEKQEVIVFVVNRSLTEDMNIDFCFNGFSEMELIEHVELYSDNMKATNSLVSKEVEPLQRELNYMKSGSQLVKLKKHSWNMLRYFYGTK